MWKRQDIERYLKERVCQSDQDDCIIFYGSLYELAGINAEDIGQRQRIHDLLGEISEDEVVQGRPLLSVIVVTQDTYMPGRGFFNLAQRLLPEQYTGQSQETIFMGELKRVKALKHLYCEQTGNE